MKKNLIIIAVLYSLLFGLTEVAAAENNSISNSQFISNQQNSVLHIFHRKKHHFHGKDHSRKARRRPRHLSPTSSKMG